MAWEVFMAKTLGILGGLGPAASVYFYKLITEHTYAMCDQDHISLILMSDASIPDRSDFILQKSDLSPLDAMKADVAKLVGAGADLIAIPCNTAHYFYHELECISPVPVINIVRETVGLARDIGVHRLGILATSGTVAACAYQKICSEYGLRWTIPSDAGQAKLMTLIYDFIKRAKEPDLSVLEEICEDFLRAGCDMIALGCTELSLIPEEKLPRTLHFIDSMKVLAKKSILACGKIPCGFSSTYDAIHTDGLFSEPSEIRS